MRRLLHARNPHLCQTAFTLIELSVAIIVLGILGFLVFRVVNNATEEAKVVGCVQNIQTEIRYLQSQARSTQRAHQVVFDPLNNRYSTNQEVSGAWSALEANKDPGCDIVDTTLVDHILTFNFRGFAYEGNELPSQTPTNPVEVDRTVTLSSSQQKILTIFSTTGLTQ